MDQATDHLQSDLHYRAWLTPVIHLKEALLYVNSFKFSSSLSERSHWWRDLRRNLTDGLYPIGT
jgi:hypothetical protein